MTPLNREGMTEITETGEKIAELPAGVITDQYGALLVADDVGDVIWRIAVQDTQ